MQGRPLRRPETGSIVTQKPPAASTPEQSLAIALENVTPETVSAARDTGRDAPRVVASGRGAVAEQILQIAFERGVKVRTDSDLAEILAAIEVDSEIPLAALAGVAEILRYLYQTDRQPAAGERKNQDDDQDEENLT